MIEPYSRSTNLSKCYLLHAVNDVLQFRGAAAADAPRVSCEVPRCLCRRRLRTRLPNPACQLDFESPSKHKPRAASLGVSWLSVDAHKVRIVETRGLQCRPKRITVGVP